ncbi:hypothetical protein QR680_018515 [Steinernema hermaphroditum]|uniref:Uncharacterized protein n=1 Tax=Steinernema hermaphroditum TaxID=289476 RepID=A0AA39LQF8_9BILA|nr:hypothetical protein QR680_018515 [Steinernema hermaphroditum]
MPTGRSRFPSTLRKMTEEELEALEEYSSSERVALLQRAVVRMEKHLKEQERELEIVEKLLRPKPELYGVVEMRDTYMEAITKLREALIALRAVLKHPVLFDTDANRHVIVHLERTERNMSRLLDDLQRANPIATSPIPLSSEKYANEEV